MFLLLLLFQPNQMGSGYQNPPELLMLSFRLIKGKEPLRKENLGCSSSELFFARTTRKCCTFESHCCCSNCLGVESCISNLFCETTEGTAVCNYYSKNGHFILKYEMSRDIHIIDIPKIPENLRKCQYCSSNEIESEIHFENVFHAPLQLTNDMKLKYAGFDSYHVKTLQYVYNERSIKE